MVWQNAYHNEREQDRRSLILLLRLRQSCRDDQKKGSQYLFPLLTSFLSRSVFLQTEFSIPASHLHPLDNGSQKEAGSIPIERYTSGCATGFHSSAHLPPYLVCSACTQYHRLRDGLDHHRQPVRPCRGKR